MNFKINNYQDLSVTQMLIGFNVAIYIVMYFFGFSNYFIEHFCSLGVVSGVYNPITGETISQTTIFETNQYYRFLTSNYLHGHLMHVMFNMIALYSLGEVIESLIGRKKFLIVYTLSGVGGSLLSSIMNIYLMPNEIIRSVGASGAVFGIAGCLVVLAIYRRNRGMDLLYRINYQPLVLMLGLNLVMGHMIEGIDNWGHIGGLITGCLIGGIYSYMIEKRNLNNF